MAVIKRNYKETDLNIDEIRNAVSWACLDLDVESLELESHINSIYNGDVTTTKIQQSLIDTALALTSVEAPDWRVVAARLYVMELYKEVSHYRDCIDFPYCNYLEFVKSAVKKGLYDPKILELYSADELDEAGTFIFIENDLDYDYAGINILANRYLIKDGIHHFELPQQMYLTIALWLASVEEKDRRMEFAREVYSLISKRKLSLATPILSNLRKKGSNLSSCFITAADDSLDSIFHNIAAVAKISKNGGGAGVCLSRIRARGAMIKNTPGASGGVVPWIRLFNDTAVAVNQLGKRAGALTTALDIWHLDIEDFLELQTETGDQRKKAYDIFPQVVIPDLFMKRVDKKIEWTLLDPGEVRRRYGIELAELWGEDFERRYTALEYDDSIKLKKRVNARDLMKSILKSQVETGMPYIFFKDTVNRLNPNKHTGMIGCGNLCQESFSNFSPTRPSDSSDNGEMGTVHTCNLLSINLANVEGLSEIEYLASSAVRILDNTIDLTGTPIPESDRHNSLYRAIGVGAMGLADFLVVNKKSYEKSVDFVSDLFEKIAYHAISASVDLAIERGSYRKFHGSDWDNGIVLGRKKEWFDKNSSSSEKWEKLARRVKKYGIRNSHLLAIAPNTSSALLQGCSPSVLPIFSKFHMDKSANGAVPICPPFIRDYFWYYKENRHMDQKSVVEMIAAIQKWVDQGISFELLYNLNNNVRAKDIYETVFEAWQKGCKTIYYTRTIQKNSNVAGANSQCVSCAN